MVGLAPGGYRADASVAFYLLVYLVSCLAAFGVAAIVAGATGREDMREYIGLSESNPRLAFVMMLSLFSLSGIPPLAGFLGKFYLFAAAAEKGMAWLVLVGAVNSTVSLFYYLTVIRWMYIEKPTAEQSAVPPIRISNCAARSSRSARSGCWRSACCRRSCAGSRPPPPPGSDTRVGGEGLFAPAASSRAAACAVRRNEAGCAAHLLPDRRSPTRDRSVVASARNGEALMGGRHAEAASRAPGLSLREIPCSSERRRSFGRLAAQLPIPRLRHAPFADRAALEQLAAERARRAGRTRPAASSTRPRRARRRSRSSPR